MIRTQHKALWIIALIAVVNALGYGIIIPVLYTYSRQFGLTDFQNGLLFSIYSLCQFLATPLIGRLSDAYGRRPLLLLSLFGTSLSFFMMAFAPSAAWLFVARALDGITAGNIPVALAVISDTTEVKNRAKGFGIIGAAFGFGFTFGPAISALGVRWGLGIPFIIAGTIAAVSWVLTALVLPETNTNKSAVASRRIFDFRHLIDALLNPNIATMLVTSFLVMLAFSVYVFVFQPVAVQIFGLSASAISIIFTAIGVIGLLSQTLVIPQAVRLFGERNVLVYAIFVSVVMYAALLFVRYFPLFVAVVLVQAFANGFTNPVIQSILSKEADEKSQGSIMGVNASYQSIGQTLGPIVGGILTTVYIPLPFLLSSIIMGAAVFLAIRIRSAYIRRMSLV